MIKKNRLFLNYLYNFKYLSFYLRMSKIDKGGFDNSLKKINFFVDFLFGFL